MKLNTWSKPTQWISEKNLELEESGIIEAHRFLYLFFNPDDIEDHNNGLTIKGKQLFGKAIQINLSLSRGGKDNVDIYPWLRGTNNSTYMTIALYVYDTVFQTDITNIYESKFILDNAIIASTTNDYDIGKAMTNGENLYAKDLRDKPEVKDLISTRLLAGAPSIPIPKYYTIRQQDYATDDMFCITSVDYSFDFSGAELLDDNTRISVMNVFDIDTMEMKMRDKIYEVRRMAMNPILRGTQTYDQTRLSETLLYQDLESMQNGYTYIYDSQMGVNIIKTGNAYMPFTKYQFEPKMIGDLERTLSQIKLHCKGVEKEYGSIRMMFTPLYYGDKMDIIFKDYKPENQPVLKNKMQIDNNSKVKNEISNIVDDIEEFGELDDNPSEEPFIFDDLL